MTFPDERAILEGILKRARGTHVVELGAHDGEDTAWMTQVNQNLRFLCVEADPVNYAVLVGRNLPAAIPVHGAIYDHDGTCEFWQSRSNGGGFGSIYQPFDSCGVSARDFTKIGPIPCYTMDSLCEQYRVQEIELLYVDIHGAEKDMIAHGRKALSKTRYLFMEVFGHEAYAGMVRRDALLSMLPHWKTIHEFPWNVLLENEEMK